MAGRISRKDKKRFVASLAEDGNVARAAERIGRERTWLYTVRKRDPVFAAEWDEARRSSLDELEGQLLDWAVNGFTLASTESVVDEKGNKVGREKRRIERRYDARLLLRILERRHPDYKPGSDVQLSSPTGVLIVPGVSATEEEWEKEFGASDDSKDD